METLVKKGSLGSILFKSQIITEADILSALEEQKRLGCRFGEALIALGVVTQEDIDWALSNQLDIPYVRLKPEMVDAEAVALVPPTVARRHMAVPLIKVGDELHVAIADPLNKEGISALAQCSGCTVSVSVALLREIREMHELLYGDADEPSLFFHSYLYSPEVLATINGDATCGKLLDYLLLLMVRERFRALSCSRSGTGVSITARSGTSRRDVGTVTTAAFEALLNRIRQVANLRGDAESQAGRITFRYGGSNVLIDVSLLSQAELLTFRFHVPAVFPQKIDENLDTARVRELLNLEDGVILFAAADPDHAVSLMELFAARRTQPAQVTVRLTLPHRAGKGAVHLVPGREAKMLQDSLRIMPDLLMVDGVDLPALRRALCHREPGTLLLAAVVEADPMLTTFSVVEAETSCPSCSSGAARGEGCATCNYTGITRIDRRIELRQAADGQFTDGGER